MRPPSPAPPQGSLSQRCRPCPMPCGSHTPSLLSGCPGSPSCLPPTQTLHLSLLLLRSSDTLTPLGPQPEIQGTKVDLHGQRSLAGYSPWGHKELDMTGELSIPSLRQASYRVCMHIHLFNFLNNPMRKSENKPVLCSILQMRKLRSR